MEALIVLGVHLVQATLESGLRSRLLRVPLVRLWKVLKPRVLQSTAIRFSIVAFDNKMFSGRARDRSATEFDRSGNISGLKLNLLPDKTWEIYRSDDLVDAFEVKRYLEDVDEI